MRTSLAVLPQLTPLAIGLTIPIMWLYYVLFEASSWQATPGKRVLRLYVTDLNGRPITFARATIRHFGKNDFRTDVSGGLLPCGIHREEASAARHACQLPRPAAAVAISHHDFVNPFLWISSASFRRDSNVKASSEITPAPVVASARAAAPSSNGTSYCLKA